MEDTVVWSTNNPYSESLVRVRDLIRYPYGCVEQTSSSLRPLISAADILRTVEPMALRGNPLSKWSNQVWNDWRRCKRVMVVLDTGKALESHTHGVPHTLPMSYLMQKMPVIPLWKAS